MGDRIVVDPHPLGSSGLSVSPIGFGAFKIGRNEQIKYPHGYDLPTDDEVDALIRGVLDLGVNYFDTAPAYGSSEARLGAALEGVEDVVISTKVGEIFENGRSRFDFTDAGVRTSLEQSRKLLRRDVLDLVFVHSDGNDLRIQENTSVVSTLTECVRRGKIRAIGFSGKTVEGTRSALEWADVVMVEYHRDDPSHAEVMREASNRGSGVVVKKGLGSGRIPAAEAVEFVLSKSFVNSLVVGSLRPDHLRQNVEVAEALAGRGSRR